MFLLDVLTEYAAAVAQHPNYHSFHEAFGVLLEEVEEFKAEVWKKQHLRDTKALYQELVQIATVCLRTVQDLGMQSEAETPRTLLQELAHSQGYGLVSPPRPENVAVRNGHRTPLTREEAAALIDLGANVKHVHAATAPATGQALQDVRSGAGTDPAQHPFTPCCAAGCSHVSSMHGADTRCTVTYCQCPGFQPGDVRRDPWQTPGAEGVRR